MCKQVKQDKYCFLLIRYLYIQPQQNKKKREVRKKRGKTTLYYFQTEFCYRNNRLERCYKSNNTIKKTAGSWLGQNMLKYLTHKLRTQSINEDNVQEKVRIMLKL